jgi:hypothetical protein
MAELADALDSGSSELRLMGVQVPLRAKVHAFCFNELSFLFASQGHDTF